MRGNKLSIHNKNREDFDGEILKRPAIMGKKSKTQILKCDFNVKGDQLPPVQISSCPSRTELSLRMQSIKNI
jgi:hypothetical protein